jgi:hypothetical protein
MSVEITQADREAAAQIYIWFPALSSSVDAAHKTAQLIRDGGADGWNSVRLMRDHRHQAEEAMRTKAGDLLRKAIEDGYPTPPDKTTQCEHGQFGWEDCIACYDEQLLKTEAAIRSIDTRGE